MQVLLAAAENIAPRAMQEGKAQAKRQRTKKPAPDASRKPLTAFFSQAAASGKDAEAEAEAEIGAVPQPKEPPRKVHPFFAGPRPARPPAVVDLVEQQQQQPEVEDLTLESPAPQRQSPAARRSSVRAASVRAASNLQQQDRDSDFEEVIGVSSDEEEQPKRRKTAAKTHGPGAPTAKQPATKPKAQPAAANRKRGLMDRFLRAQGGEPVEEGSKLLEELARSREATVAFFGGKEINPFFLAPAKRQPADTIAADHVGEADYGTSVAPSQWVDVVFPAPQHVFSPDTARLNANAPGALLINGRPAAARSATTVDVCAICPRVSELSDLYKYCAAAWGALRSVYDGAVSADDAAAAGAGGLRPGQLFENPAQAGPYVCLPAEEVRSQADLRTVWQAAVECQPSSDANMAAIAHEFGARLRHQPEYVELQLSTACERAEDPSRAGMLWVDRHRPAKTGELCGNSNAILEFTSWLKQWSSKRKNPPKPKPRKSRRGWDSDDDSFDDDLCKLAVLYGKNGTCKTTAVYTCAAQLGYNVLEVKPDEKRQGTELRKRLAEATQSHRVSSKLDGESAGPTQPPPQPAAQRKRGRPRLDEREDVDFAVGEPQTEGPGELTLVLFEQADIYFEDESGFYATIKDLAKSAKCPLVITSETSLTSELPAVDHLPIAFELPTTAELAFRLAVVCHAEKLSLSAQQLVQLVHCCGHDIRAALYSLQMYAVQAENVTSTVPPAAWNSSCDFAQLHQRLASPARQAVAGRHAWNQFLQFLPLLAGVQPRVLRHGERCMIYGSGFLQPAPASKKAAAAEERRLAHVTVIVGGCSCESVVLSDEVISILIPADLQPGVHRVVVRVGNHSTAFQQAWDATIKVVVPASAAETSRDEVASSTSDDFDALPPSPDAQRSSREQSGGRLRKLTCVVASDSDDDFADTPPDSVRGDKRSKRQRIVEDDDEEDNEEREGATKEEAEEEEENQEEGEEKAADAVADVSPGAERSDVHPTNQPASSASLRSAEPMVFCSPPADLTDQLRVVLQQRAEVVERFRTVDAVGKLPSHLLVQCTPGEGAAAAADAEALDDIASALDAFSTADFLSNWPRGAEGDEYCDVGPRRLGVDVRNLTKHKSSPLALDDDSSSVYEWGLAGPSEAASLRFLARSRLQAWIPAWNRSDDELASFSDRGPGEEGTPPEAQQAIQHPVTSATPPAEERKRAAEEKEKEEEEEAEFELDMDVAGEDDNDDAAASQSSGAIASSTDVALLNADDLLVDLLAQELLRARLFRCTLLMQLSQVDKFRSPQLLQGGGTGVVLDYIPFMATMMRLDASSPYAKTTGRRGRMNRMRQATNLDGAQLDEVAGIGNIRSCEDFRETCFTRHSGA